MMTDSLKEVSQIQGIEVVQAGLEPIPNQNNPHHVVVPVLANESVPRESRICGLRKMTFWLAVIVAALVAIVIALAVGLGVGLTSMFPEPLQHTRAYIKPLQGRILCRRLLWRPPAQKVHQPLHHRPHPHRQTQPHHPAHQHQLYHQHPPPSLTKTQTIPAPMPTTLKSEMSQVDRETRAIISSVTLISVQARRKICRQVSRAHSRIALLFAIP